MKEIQVLDIELRGKYQVNSLQNLCLHGQVNEHGVLTYEGYVDEREGRRLLNQPSSGEWMELLVEGNPVFWGEVSSISLIEENTLFVLSVQCISASKQLDKRPHNRFFQNVKKRYTEILTQICEDADAALVGIVGYQEISKPILQYQETDWQFALRIAGKIGTVIVPDLYSKSTQIALGIPRGRNYTAETAEFTSRKRLQSYLHKREAYKDTGYRDFISYTLHDPRVFALGDKVRIDDSELAVMEMTLCLEGGVLHNRYELGRERDYCAPLKENELQIGIMLPGQVLDTSGSNVKVKLDIEDHCDKKTAFEFGYAPQTNNGMYCMPEIGTKVMMKWKNGQDGDILAVHCMRENGSDCSELAHSCNRFLTTAHKKRLAMLPNELYFKGGGNQLRLRDSNGIRGKSSKQLSVSSQKSIQIHAGRNVFIESPEEIKMVKAGVASGIDMAGGDIHVHSRHVNVRKVSSKAPVPLFPEPEEHLDSVSLMVGLMAAGMIPAE